MQNLKAALLRIAIFCDHWHWVWIALAAPFLLFPSPTRSSALLVVPGLWIVAWLAGRDPLPRTPLNLVLLLMSAMVLVSLWATYDMAVSLPNVANMVLGIGVFFAFVREGKRPIGWWLCLSVFLIVGMGVGSLGLFTARWIDKVGPLASVASQLPRFTSLPLPSGGLHPNTIAAALLWVIPMVVVLSAEILLQHRLLRESQGRVRAIAIAVIAASATLFLVGTLILTQSRSGYIGLAFGGLVLAILIVPPRWRKRYVGSLILMMALASIITVRFGAETVIAQILGKGVAADPALSLDTLDTFEGRIEIWSRALYGIRDFPFTGMGMNTFRHVMDVLYPLFLVSPEYDIGSAHNEFLQAALDLGLPGLIAFIALYMNAFWMLLAAWRVGDGRQTIMHGPLSISTRSLIIGLAAGLVAYLVFSLTNAIALGWRYGIIFWMLLGLVVGLFLQKHSRQPGVSK